MTLPEPLVSSKNVLVAPITRELETKGLEADSSIVEYVIGILEDETLSTTEIEDTVSEFILSFQDSTYRESDVAQQQARSTAKTLRGLYLEHLNAQPSTEQNNALVLTNKTGFAVPTEISEAIQSEAPSEAILQKEAEEADARWQPTHTHPDKTKQTIIEKYGIEFDDTLHFSEDGRLQSFLKEANIPQSLASQSFKKQTETGDPLWVNTNRANVLKAAQDQREMAKKKHEEEAAKIKLLRQKQREAKDKEKQRVTRNERRTGR